MMCSSAEHTNRIQSDGVIKSGEATSHNSTKVIVRKDLVELQESLRLVKLLKSTRGGSIFSPGEAFWNEAIQIADGVFYRNDNPSEQVAEEMKGGDRPHEKKFLNNIRNEECGSKDSEILCEGSSRDYNMELCSTLPPVGKNGKDLDKEVSPLPVKHFNFALEDKYLGEDAPRHFSANNFGIVLRDGEQIECSSVNEKALRTANTNTPCNQVHSNGGSLEVQGATSSCTIAKTKVDIFSQGATSNTPERDTINFSTNCPNSEESTPSSFVLPKYHLDLSSWLPSELCSLYKKKGISKLYQWQAALYQTNFRPVPLEEYIKVGNTIYNNKMEIVRTISKAADLGGKDPDHILELCNEVVQDGHSVLIFCSSRKGCESTARHVAKYLKKFCVSAHSDQSEFTDINSAIDALQKAPAGLDPILDETHPSGVAYHHAGLMVEEREVVETCYVKDLNVF